ncbi:sugar phosphate isomerase/epimerase family protein [Limnovirga soli]|uniref:TIM barrel protein n=1 Tax=Limnovirga soli TaxID=2656915 RepID=A0A8J8FBC3_9BACT|nr:sugar phosphate isomerase/epimerase family protein [Limnovirga soli]NNV54883.1 TIM barrel protein [Limnovirga soli]
MINRRTLLALSGSALGATFLPVSFVRAATTVNGPFRFCLNTSTISGQQPGLVGYINIAAKAGYDGLELWINDITDYLNQGNTLETLAGIIRSKGLVVENAISFTSWMAADATKRNEGLAQLENEMKMMAVLGCHRIAAPPMGVEQGAPLNIEEAAAHYRDVLNLGRKYNVMPLLEFWGASGTLYNFSQALSIAAAANDADARILPDVYHLFRGGSGFNGLQLVNGKVIDVIHMNDYPANKPVNEQTDSDRVYPGDGVAPLKQILRDLKAMGGTKVLSLELFNETYWKEDALSVATTGLRKMQLLVKEVLQDK